MSCATVINPLLPIPVRARNMMSCGTVFAKDEANDPMKKIAMPANKITLRDQISDSRPYRSWPTVEVLEEVNVSKDLHFWIEP